MTESSATNNADLKALLTNGSPVFWDVLSERTQATHSFETMLSLSTLRKRAQKISLEKPSPFTPLKIALLSGYTLYPLQDLIEHSLTAAGFECEVFAGDYDNYVAEVMDETSSLYQFAPQIVFLMPSSHRCRFQGSLADPLDDQKAQAIRTVEEILTLCRTIHERAKCEVILSNFLPPARFDLGAFRSRTLGSEWSFKKLVNLELGLRAPSFMHVCDTEFLACRQGTLGLTDERLWFESKQPCSPDFMVAIAREVKQIVSSLYRPQKKVVVLDLDNTLWGGVIGDDGLEGIEIGSTSPRGEAFRAFQTYLLSLAERGVLLTVCSKNDQANAVEPFQKHPEMVLKLSNFVSFKANWDSKADNIRQMATELNLGLDSFVFVDDNPAETEIVRQFLPEVATICLNCDPSEFVPRLQDARFFEPRSITKEDLARVSQYQQEGKRTELLASVTDMPTYLKSLEMEAEIREFTTVDAPRLSQLINKSNQFNLTTVRRSEAEVLALIDSPDHRCFSVRLRDRFGDSGLISVVILKLEGDVAVVDTWLMSCRVLKRQVEDLVLSEIARLAREKNCRQVRGVYLPTKKNGMVRDLYPKMGFTPTSEATETTEPLTFNLDLNNFNGKETHIKVTRRSYEAGRSH